MRKKTQYIVVNEIYKTIYCGYPQKRAWKNLTTAEGGAFSKVKKLIQMTGKAKRWDMIPSGYEKFGNLVENLTINTEQEALPKSRLDSDWQELERIKELYGIK